MNLFNLSLHSHVYLQAFVVLILFPTFQTSLAQKKYQPICPDPVEESWRWKHITDLDKESVFSVTEDKDGDLWFGVTNGLVQYDGYHFKKYNLTTLGSRIRALRVFATEEGILYCQFKNLFMFDGKNWAKIFHHGENNYDDLQLDNNWINPLYFKKISENISVVGSKLGLLLIHNKKYNLYTSGFVRDNLKSTHPHLIYHSLDSLFGSPKEIVLIALFNNANSFSSYFEVDGKQYKVDTRIDTINGLMHFDKKTTTDIHFPNDRYSFHESADSSTWISHQGPFSDLIKISDNSTYRYDFSQLFGGNNITTQIVETSDGNILIGGVGCIFSIKSGQVKKYSKPDVPLSSDLKVILYKDSKDNIWVINQMAQVYRLEYHNNHWQTYPDLSFQMETDDGSKWFISKNNKIIKQEKSGKDQDTPWYYYDRIDGLMSHPLGIIQTKRGDVWCSGNHFGKAATAYLKNNKWHMQIHEFAWSIDGSKTYEANNGSIWFSSYKDLFYRGPGVLELRYNHLDSLNWKQWKRPIFASGGFAEFNDKLWGASTMGLFKATNKTSYGGDMSFFSEVDDIQADHSGNLWVGTRKNGIALIKRDGTRTLFKSPLNLVSNIIIDLQIANDSALWVVTEKDFSYFDGKDWTNNCLPEQLLFNLEGGKLNLTKDENVWISKFDKKWSRQMYRNNPGKRYSGEFYSVRYRREKYPPETYINIHQDTVSADGNVYITWSGIDKWERTSKNGLQFSYKLDDNPWSPFTYKTGHTFTSLLAGKHTLQVRSKDKDSNIDASPAVIRFIVLPPMWKHPLFISLFLFLLAVIVYQWIRIIKRKNWLANLNLELHDANSELEIKNKEIERQKERMLKQKDELYHLKLNFFTNISHEFRTPLSLIKGAVDNVKRSKFDIDVTQKYIDVAERNSNILINLVSEILEFRKIETGKLKLKAQKTNLHDFLYEITLSFKELSLSKNISFEFDIVKDCEVWIDLDKMTKIIYNLLSNAFKFTQSNGKVRLSAGNIAMQANPMLTNKYNIFFNAEPLTEFIEIVVEDSGIGIQQSSLDKIFEDFYQEDNGYQHLGSGIGLALIKHTVLLHKADLLVTSKPGIGTRFTLHLPKGKEFLEENEIVENEITIDHQLNQYQNTNITKPNIAKDMDIKDEESTKLLIVEDNDELREYLKDIFLENHEVIEAANGLDGLNLANEHIPNLIISDIMMPQMDGNEMSAKIKSNINTSHIPIILLTAKTAPQYELEGLSTGADLYISKPFDKQTLEMQVNNMIRTQQNSIDRIRKSNPFEINEVSVNNSDNEFIQGVMDIIKANKDTINFGVENLAEELNMSRKNLYRKLKMLTGISPIEFIKNVRLGFATDLLQNTNLSISEIAYQSGFNNTTYMFKVFKEKFDCTPKEYRNRYKN